MSATNFDRSEILRSAWRRYRVYARGYNRKTFDRALFAACLRRVWAEAKQAALRLEQTLGLPLRSCPADAARAPLPATPHRLHTRESGRLFANVAA